MLALPLFFVIWWTMNRVTRKRNSFLIPAVAALLLSPLLLIGLTRLFMVGITYEPSRAFSEASWQNNPDSRYHMAGNLVNDGLLVGKDTMAVKELIGDPFFRRDMQNGTFQWEYKMGEGAGGMGAQYHFLLLTVNKNKVTEAFHSRMKD